MYHHAFITCSLIRVEFFYIQFGAFMNGFISTWMSKYFSLDRCHHYALSGKGIYFQIKKWHYWHTAACKTSFSIGFAIYTQTLSCKEIKEAVCKRSINTTIYSKIFALPNLMPASGIYISRLDVTLCSMHIGLGPCKTWTLDWTGLWTGLDCGLD